MTDKPDPKREILKAARDLIASGGVDALSFDAIARRIGRTKQAVLYWYPTKPDLLAALFLPWLEQETLAAETALAGQLDRKAAIAAFVHSTTAFHLADLDRFRLMYLLPQTTRARSGAPAVMARVHPVTDRLYAALAARLSPNDPPAARAQAAAIHAAALGLVLMLSLAEALNDPLKHATDALVAALVAALTQSAG